MRLLADLSAVSLPVAAARVAAAGLPVFPCRAGQKRPLTSHGLLDASTDAGQVAAWWRRWPAANIGLPTGTVSGLVVLDVDVRASGSGLPTFRHLTRQGLADGWAALVSTPSGGLHAYYPATGEARCWQSADRHVDFRGDGGYVAIPPSVVRRADATTGGYRVSRIAEQVPRPIRADTIRDLLLPHPRPAPDPTTGPGRGAGRVASADRLAAWVAARGEGERNRGLFWAACRLAETGTPIEQIQAALGPAAAHAGLPDFEVAATIRSATRTTTDTHGRTRDAPAAPALPLRAVPSRPTPTPAPGLGPL